MNNKKNQHRIIIILAIFFIAIILGIIAYFVINYTNDQNEMKARMDEVEEGYNTFKEHIDSFNAARDNVYKEAMQDMYYDTLKENDLHYKELLTTYEGTLESLDQDYENLKGKCTDVLYPNVSINNKCEAFVIGYEEAMNTFVSDVERYNKNIEAYNEWLKEEGKTDTELVTYETKRTYVDIVGDREYRGKKETASTMMEEEQNE